MGTCISRLVFPRAISSFQLWQMKQKRSLVRDNTGVADWGKSLQDHEYPTILSGPHSKICDKRFPQKEILMTRCRVRQGWETLGSLVVTAKIQERGNENSVCGEKYRILPEQKHGMSPATRQPK